jgi:hypothetical protein
VIIVRSPLIVHKGRLGFFEKSSAVWAILLAIAGSSD